MKKYIWLAALLVAAPAFSQTPSLTFTLETTTPDGKQVVPKLTWSTTPAATSCTASGSAAWTGTKPASGTATLAAVAASQTYAIVCNWPGVSVVGLTWTAPTTNTDGSPLTNLAGFRVQWGQSEATLGSGVYLDTPTARSWTSPALAAGTWYFGVRAYNTLGLESALSNIANKATTAGQSANRSLVLTIQFPNPPVLQ